jgi:hypothetical protein
MQITIGRIFLKSGSVLEFAAELLEFNFSHGEGITSRKHTFVEHGYIKRISYLDYEEVAAIVVDKQVTAEDYSNA